MTVNYKAVLKINLHSKKANHVSLVTLIALLCTQIFSLSGPKEKKIALLCSILDRISKSTTMGFLRTKIYLLKTTESV